MNTIIEKLDSVRQTGAGRWLAKCPAHDDKTPSLAIRETDDGTILLHCFTGCEVSEITRALHIELTDLFPAADRHHRPRERRPFPAIDVLRAVSHEMTIAVIALADVVSGREISGADLNRVLLAHDRVRQALSIAEGK